MGRMAGWSHETASTLAYYTQLPDEVPAYDAVWVIEPHSPSTMDAAARQVSDHFGPGRLGGSWAKEVQKYLHQLHGGDILAIQKNRECLKKLFNEYMMGGDFASAGTMLHAFGDSFAHTFLSNGQRQAYAYPFGHAGAKGSATGRVVGKGAGIDMISERGTIGDNAYHQYVNQLADLFGVQDQAAVEAFQSRFDAYM